MAAGLDPAAFWRETPRSFVTIMEGIGRAAKRKHDSEIALAWHTAVFNAKTKSPKDPLKGLRFYLGDGKQQQTPKQMLGTLLMLHDMGAPMNIKKLH